MLSSHSSQPLSPLGLGAWAFGRTGWGAQDDRDSRAAIIRAVELGVSWIDTAAVYGDGHSEELLGETLGELPERERPLLFTKCGVRVNRASGATFRDLRSFSIRQECEQSLRRLRVERIDLYQLHWPVEDPRAVEEAWETLGNLQDEGKIRWAGVSNFDVASLQKCAARRPPDAVQIPLSLLSRGACADVLPWAARGGARALAYSPLESGLLSGQFSPQRLRALPDSDWRRKRSQFQQPKLDHTLALLALLKPIAAELGCSIPELAIAWTLMWPGVAGVIVGARNAAQVDGWAGAARLTLDDRSCAEIEAALIATGAGSGPTRPGMGTSGMKPVSSGSPQTAPQRCVVGRAATRLEPR